VRFPNLKPSTTTISIQLPVRKKQATIEITEGKINKALNWTKKRQTLIEDDYYDGYRVLQNLFDNLDLANELNVIAAAYAVYGWMPTILKKKPKAADLVEFAQAWKNKKRDRCSSSAPRCRQADHLVRATSRERNL
jgi:hypothetical protein